MNDLFDHAKQYPNRPGFAKGSKTSREAADKLTSRSVVAETVLRALRINDQGLSVDDVKKFAESALAPRTFDRSTIAARFTELEKLGKIYKTGEETVSRHGRPVAIYKIK